MLLTFAMIAAAGGALFTLAMTLAFAVDPDWAMRRAHHRLRDLPAVMTGRYAGFTALAAGSALYGDAIVILYLFVVFAAISFYDAYLYASQGEPWWPHAVAGGLCFLVIGFAGAAVIAGY
ncbi:MAG: hypothetical protein AAGG09_10990 [Pseudomonadota bacterium]